MADSGKRLTKGKRKYSAVPLTSDKPNSKKESVLFSFKYFDHKKIPEMFGIGQADSKWYISILERLKSIESMDYSWEGILSGSLGSNPKTLRIHPIDWDAKNIPISRNKLDWLPKDIIDNNEEFPLYQLSISTGKGRIIGFIDKCVYYIVLLDHNHNLQPSAKSNYGTINTTIGISEYDDLLCKTRKCICQKQYINASNVVYHFLDEDFYNLHCKGKYSPQEIYEAGLLYLNLEDKP